MCRFQRNWFRSVVGAWLLAASMVGFGTIARAQGPAATTPNRPTPAPGTWTIAVVTSTTDPGSKGLLQSLRSNPWIVANADRVRLAEINGDATGRPSGGSSTAVLVYQQVAKGSEMIGGRSGFASPDDVVVWVRSLVAASNENSIRDPNLAQANLNGKSMPSAQGETPSYQAPTYTPPAAPSYPQAYLPQPQTTTTFAMPMAVSPAAMIQAPQQQLVIQQPPPQVLFAPQTTPMVYMPQAASPTPNLFMPSMPMMGVAPNAGMPMVAAPQAMATAPAAQPVGVPVGPTLAGASLTTSSFSVPASSTTTRIKVKGPGPVASALARFGERLTTLGRTRIESVQETRLETQTATTPPGQFMTLSSTSASPVLNPPQPPPAVPQSIPVLPPASPQSPQASPQAGAGRWH